MQKHACIRAKKKSWQTSFSRIRHKKGRLYESLKTEKNLLLLNFASGVQRKFIHSFKTNEFVSYFVWIFCEG